MFVEGVVCRCMSMCDSVYVVNECMCVRVSVVRVCGGVCVLWVSLSVCSYVSVSVIVCVHDCVHR